MLRSGESLFAKKFRRPEQFLQARIRQRIAFDLFTFVFGQRRHAVVETGDLHATFGIAHLREQLAQCHGRVFYRAAEDAGMQIARRSVQRNLKSNDAAQRVSERRMFRCWHARIGNDDGIAREFLAMRFEKTGKTFTADLLLAFQHKRQIAG